MPIDGNRQQSRATAEIPSALPVHPGVQDSAQTFQNNSSNGPPSIAILAIWQRTNLTRGQWKRMLELWASIQEAASPYEASGLVAKPAPAIEGFDALNMDATGEHFHAERTICATSESVDHRILELRASIQEAASSYEALELVSKPVPAIRGFDALNMDATVEHFHAERTICATSENVDHRTLDVLDAMWHSVEAAIGMCIGLVVGAKPQRGPVANMACC
ncbi:hypothetical protein CLAFUW4_05387 [Fulvia fulva]|uniref:Uncharacterized protein n=1 Tax=Passalora fulva TaxID=5499 RepID=A0A9Q8P9B4_PASFU|nr:uncharacterized protein CLAFUR5_05535 [Fulvia fulva]KAK4623814.1 hypothetical protein CLAFUR4_05381 [Fulvia fulva]KAK4625080.1 hypothetical protein CLAFUR0_05389 [Fulvia fulva]UJO17983.1 hypothetical protein CLAFUR5_05535 [Fulvia fulva]WPV15211.1 hypothetical protein CLAFUW4_05387 [Fulvia fulva]WPV30460.1 hypothetical protein CLAFUW7_05385 [Fulvia fulva]